MGNLTPREKQMVLGGGFLAIVFICIQFIYLPAFDKNQSLNRTLAAEEDTLEQIGFLEQEYQNLAPDHTTAIALLKNRNKGFTLFSFLDRQASQTGVKANIDYMKPHTRELENQSMTLSVVKLKLKQVVFKDFIRFIRAVESPKNGIWITSLTLTQSGKTEKRLDAVLEAQTIMTRGEES